jgi:hypothetical protein
MRTFRITVCSDPGYEDLVAELYCQDKFIGLISQENGEHRLHIAQEPVDSAAELVVSLDEFEAALGLARRRLWELRRVKSGQQDESASDP